jgi:hypothetical protein
LPSSTWMALNFIFGFGKIASDIWPAQLFLVLRLMAPTIIFICLVTVVGFWQVLYSSYIRHCAESEIMIWWTEEQDVDQQGATMWLVRRNNEKCLSESEFEMTKLNSLAWVCKRSTSILAERPLLLVKLVEIKGSMRHARETRNTISIWDREPEGKKLLMSSRYG